MRHVPFFVNCQGRIQLFFPLLILLGSWIFLIEKIHAQTPVVGIPHYVNGPSSGSTQKAFIASQYMPGSGASSLSSGPSAVGYLATFGQIGSAWGAVYDSRINSYYAASALKRHSGYGPDGSGAIYKISADPGSPSVSLLMNLDGLSGPLPSGSFVSINTGDASDHGALGGLTSPGTDNPAFALAGKSSLGDIDLSPDKNTLWVMNVAGRQLIEINITNPASPSITKIYPISNTSTGVTPVEGELRPWGIEVAADGTVYVGVVASAENVTPAAPSTAGPINLSSTTIRESPVNRAKLKGYVFRLDTGTGNFVQATVIDLNYARGYPSVGLAGTVAEWMPWFDNYALGFPNVAVGYFQIYPQPLISDLEILSDGSLLIALMDRFGMQTGCEGNSRPGASTTYNEQGRPCGDVVRVASTGPMTWSSTISNKYGDVMSTLEDESAMGGIAYAPGQNEFIAATIDPVSANSNGLSVIGLGVSLIDNQDLVAHTLTGGGTNGVLANDLLGSKGMALGDVEIGNLGLPPALCSITNISFSNQGACNSNGTNSNSTDDWFTADITVTFSSPPATGTLDLSGDVLSGGGATSVTVVTAGAGPTYTFTGVRLKADGTASAVTATFSADNTCTFSVTNGPSVVSCSVPPCAITAIAFFNQSSCNSNGTNSNSTDDWFTADITVTFSGPPATGTLDLSGDVLSGGGATSVTVATAGAGPTYTFTGVRLKADGTASAVTATFSADNTCTYSVNNGPAVSNCSVPPTNPCASGETGGVVWQDIDNDGIQDASEPLGISGVSVKAYDCNGNLVANVMTNTLGQYTFGTLPSGTFPIRVEFSGWSSPFVPTANGTDGRTDVQFISSAECDVDMGLVRPLDYCQMNPNIATTQFARNNASGVINTLYFMSSTLGTAFTPTNTNDNNAAWGLPTGGNTANFPLPSTVVAGNNSNTGTTFGIAYDRIHHRLFTGAAMRAFAPMGTNSSSNGFGEGKIYATSVTGTTAGTPVVWLDLETLLGDDVAGVFAADPNHPGGGTFGMTGNNPNKIGYVGLGGMEMSADGNELYVINLNTQELLVIPIGPGGQAPTSAASIKHFPIPNTGCTGEWSPGRPYRTVLGLAVHPASGRVFVTATCTGPTAANVQGVVYSVDPEDTTPAVTDFTQELTVPMNINRPVSYYNVSNVPQAYHSETVHPWENITANSVFYPNNPNLPGVGVNNATHIQPWLADIEFDRRSDGSYGMVIGERNRYNDVINGSFLTTGGVIYRACGDPSWVLSNGATCGPYTSTVNYTTSTAGRAGFYTDAHSRFFRYVGTEGAMSMGTLAVVHTSSGGSEVLTQAIDNISNNGTSGIAWLNPENGQRIKDLRLVGDFTSGGYSNIGFTKANNFGDVETMCNAVPLQIGNYVWVDTDGDGVQDPCEMALPGVNVSLYNANGTLVGQTTTNASGEYHFDLSNVDTVGVYGDVFTGLSPNTSYYIVVGTNMSQFNTTTNQLVIGGLPYSLTAANIGEGATPDQNDSDALLLSGVTGGASALNGYPGSLITTPPQGSNFTFDFGFIPVCTLTSAGETLETCNNGGTTNTAADDYITFSLNPTGLNLGATYSVSVNNGGTITPTTGTYGGATAFSLQAGSANNTLYTITVTDAGGAPCTVTTTVQQASCSCIPPVANLIAVDASCDNMVMPLNNGKIVLMGATNATHYSVSAGATYTGAGFGSATAIGGLPAVVQSGIPNTGGSYTVRVYNGSAGCYTDYPITLAGQPCPTDPMGFIYCQETGQIISGGTISVSGPGAVFTALNGSTGQYQFFTDGTAGTYTITYTPPAGYVLSGTHLPLASIDPTGQPNPYLVGSGSASGTHLDNFTPGANPYTFNFVLAPGDPEVQLNNIPLTGCCVLTSAGETLEACNDNGTVPNNTDDYITFSLNPTGVNLGASYSVTANNGGTVTLAAGGAATSVAYGSATAFRLQNGSANNTLYTITVTDSGGSACTVTTTVQRSPCSNCPTGNCGGTSFMKN